MKQNYDVQKIYEDLKNFSPDDVIAKHGLRNASQMYGMINRHGLLLRKRRSDSERALLVQDFNSGMSIEDLQRKYGYKNTHSLRTQLHIILGHQRLGSERHLSLGIVKGINKKHIKYDRKEIMKDITDNLLTTDEIILKHGFPDKKQYFAYKSKLKTGRYKF